MTRFTPTVSVLFSLLALLVLVTLPGSKTCAQSQNRDQPSANQKRQITTVAVVNGAPISRQQLAQECVRRYGEDTLERIINKFLVAQQCQAAGVRITEQDINDEITRKAEAVGISARKWVESIVTKRNVTVDQYKNDVVWNELALRRLAEGKVKVSAEEINQRMEFEFGGRVQVRQIVLDSLQKAQQIQQMATANPTEFERLAKEHSIDSNSAAMGGLMWPIRKNSGMPELEQLAFSLKPGEVSRVLPVANAFIVLRCERVFPAEQVPEKDLPRIHERIVEEISKEKLRDVAGNLFENLQQSTRIVNVMNDEKLSKQMPGVAALVNDHQILINKVAEDCITYFGIEMLETEINRTILRQSLKQKGIQIQQQDLDAEIARAAEAKGYLNDDGSVNVNGWLTARTRGDRNQVQFYVEDEVWPTVALKKLVADQVSVTDTDIKKGFEANFGPRVEVLAIVTQNQRQAQKIWTMATANRTPSYFGQLANTYSTDPMSKNNYGEIPPIQMHGGRPEIENEAFRLKPGEVSKLIQSGDSWVILFCRGRTEPVVTDLDAVKEDIYRDILEKKYRIAMAQKFQSLRNASQIDNFLTGTSQPGAAAVQAARQAGKVPFNQERR